MTVPEAIWALVVLGLGVTAIGRWKHLNAEHRRLKKNELARVRSAMEQQQAYCRAVEEAKAQGLDSFSASLAAMGLGLGSGIFGPPPKPEPEPSVLLLEYKPRD